MKQNALLVSIVSCLLFFSACQKEFSFQSGGVPSGGSLQSDVSGDCLPKTVAGIYVAGTSLVAADNYIDVQIDVSTTGSYSVSSDIVNGIFFQAKGSFTTAGLNTVRLLGNGTPTAAGSHNFTIIYDSTECVVAVSTLPQGGADPAVFTLSGGPNTCLDYVLSGAYIKDVPMTPSNTVVIKVNVTTIGTYSISTPASNGITFAGTGALTALGDQTITLTATGTPAATGSNNVAVTAGTSSCSFAVPVTGGAAFTIDCASALADGTYKAGVALNTSNTVDIDVNVTTPGAYSISTAAANGITFTGSGNFATNGPQTITLTGAGTPTAEGTFSLTITGGGSTCAFDITIDAGAPVTDLMWKFTSGGVTYEGPTFGAITLPLAGLESTGISGETTDQGISFALTLTKTAPMQATTFSTNNPPPGNMATLLLMDNASGNPVFTGILGSGTLNVVLTTYNETTKVAAGTFSGTVKNGANATVSITNGTFKAEIQ